MPTYPLTPTVRDGRLNVQVAVQNPTAVRSVLARIIGDNLVMAQMFTPVGEVVQGGGILYYRATAADRLLTGGTKTVEARTPGAEYPEGKPLEPDAVLAPVQDHGVIVPLPDEVTARSPQSAARALVQQANSLTMKLDELAIAAVRAELLEAQSPPIPGHDWSAINLFGDPTTITPSSDRFAADVAAARLAADLEQLGAQYDTLLVHPAQAYALRAAYGSALAAELESAGVTLIVNPLMTDGEAWIFQSKAVGQVGFEGDGLTVETWRDNRTRTNYVLAYAVPAFAVDGVHNMKVISDLAGTPTP